MAEFDAKQTFGWQCAKCAAITLEYRRQQPDECGRCRNDTWTGMRAVYRLTAKKYHLKPSWYKEEAYR